MFRFWLMASCLREMSVAWDFTESNLPSLAPGGYALQRLVDADDSVVVLSPLTGKCESTVVCIRCCFRNHLEEVIKVHVTRSGRWWYSGLALGYASPGPGFEFPLFADHFSFFGITAEWPKTTQIATILSSDGTYNVICI